MKDKLLFKKYDETPIDDVHKYVKDWIKENPYGTLTIGCDSQEHAKFIKYAATIIMHKKDSSGIGHGGHVIYASFKDYTRNAKSDIYTKLFFEAEVTIEAAKLVGEVGWPINIHLDYNSKPEEYSHVLYHAGLGYVSSLGYKAFGKPNSWGASVCADKIAKSGKK